MDAYLWKKLVDLWKKRDPYLEDIEGFHKRQGWLYEKMLDEWSETHDEFNEKEFNHFQEERAEKIIEFWNQVTSRKPETREIQLEEEFLRKYLVSNITLLEPDLRVYSEEFPAGNGKIDILALDEARMPCVDFVVIEIKAGVADRSAVGQILAYMGWVEDFYRAFYSGVRGIIVAKDFDKGIRLALKGIIVRIDLKRYEPSKIELEFEQS